MKSSDYCDFGLFEEEASLSLLDYSGRLWRKMSPSKQEEIVEELFNYYRNHYGFPYQRLSEEEIDSVLWRIKNRPVVFDGKDIVWDNTGSVLCTYYFPHIWTVSSRKKSIAAIDVFNDDVKFKKTIRFCLAFKDRVTPHEIITSFNLRTGVVSRFRPMVAKAIYQRYAPPNGVIYDYACGWGGRLLGAMAGGFKYIGVDPESRTHECLHRLGKRAASVYDTVSPAIYKIGSEEFCPDDLKGTVDVAFSSPPYFDLEVYSTESTQSVMKYPKINDWLNVFVRRTIQNSRDLLKPGGVFAINIEDYDACKMVSQILDLAKELGLTPLEELRMPIMQRRGNAHSSDVFRYESIHVFRK